MREGHCGGTARGAIGRRTTGCGKRRVSARLGRRSVTPGEAGRKPALRRLAILESEQGERSMQLNMATSSTKPGDNVTRPNQLGNALINLAGATLLGLHMLEVLMFNGRLRGRSHRWFDRLQILLVGIFHIQSIPAPRQEAGHA